MLADMWSDVKCIMLERVWEKIKEISNDEDVEEFSNDGNIRKIV